MNAKPYAFSRSSGFYERLISLYPSSYLAKHREELLQNYEDLERDIGSKRLFWAFIIGDFIKSIFHEYMNYIKKHRWAQFAAVVVVLLAAVAIWQFFVLQKAHSSFANYAAFRGCETITSQSATSGTCTLSNGQSITMVQVNGRWYLQGDLGW
jgi:hypothetical protein